MVGPRAVAHDVILGSETAAALRALARETGCSLSMLLLAAADAWLHSYSGQEDLIVNNVFAARNRPELAGVIGLFMNTVPVRVDLSGNPSFRSLMLRVRDALLGAYTNQDVPFPRLLTELFPGRKLTRTLLSGVSFNVLGFEEAQAALEPSSLPRLALTPFWAKSEPAKQDLRFTCRDHGEFVRCQLQAPADLFLPEELAEVAADFEALLQRIAADPDAPLL